VSPEFIDSTRPKAAEEALPADFDAAGYLQRNADVRAAGVNPADHYLRWGRNEGRSYR